jgi:hypothetical protein
LANQAPGSRGLYASGQQPAAQIEGRQLSMVLSVKVWRFMLVVKHADDNPKKD